VGLGGLIFVAIGMLWLVYLVPQFLRRHDAGLVEDVEQPEPFTESVTIVRRGVPLDVVADSTVVVSTPLNRRSALRALDLADARAAFRRRIVLGVLLFAASVLGALAGFGFVPWWTLAVPGGLIAAFVGVARVTVVRMRTDLDARARRIRAAGHSEQTVAITVLRDADDADHEESVDLTAPIAVVRSLLDPIPITRPTYVSKPLAPRTVRTIDLSAPVVGGLGGVPVTADAPQAARVEDADDADDERAINE